MPALAGTLPAFHEPLIHDRRGETVSQACNVPCHRLLQAVGHRAGRCITKSPLRFINTRKGVPHIALPKFTIDGRGGCDVWTTFNKPITQACIQPRRAWSGRRVPRCRSDQARPHWCKSPRGNSPARRSRRSRNRGLRLLLSPLMYTGSPRSMLEIQRGITAAYAPSGSCLGPKTLK